MGIDFGTTNTAVGIASDNGAVTLATLPGPRGAAATTWRTVLFFEVDTPTSAGAPAIDRSSTSTATGGWCSRSSRIWPAVRSTAPGSCSAPTRWKR